MLFNRKLTMFIHITLLLVLIGILLGVSYYNSSRDVVCIQKASILIPRSMLAKAAIFEVKSDGRVMIVTGEIVDDLVYYEDMIDLSHIPKKNKKYKKLSINECKIIDQLITGVKNSENVLSNLTLTDSTEVYAIIDNKLYMTIYDGDICSNFALQKLTHKLVDITSMDKQLNLKVSFK